MIALLLFVAGSGVGAVWTYTMFVQSPTSRFVRRARGGPWRSAGVVRRYSMSLTSTASAW